MGGEAIQDNVREMQERIAAAAAKAGRRAEEITLIAVSKTHPGGGDSGSFCRRPAALW